MGQLQPVLCISHVLTVCLRKCGFCARLCVHSYNTHCSYMQYLNILQTVLCATFSLLLLAFVYVHYVHAILTYVLYVFFCVSSTYVLAILSFSHHFVSTCTVTCTYILVLTSL